MPKVKLDDARLIWEKKTVQVAYEGTSNKSVEVSAYGPLGIHLDRENRWTVTQLSTGHRVVSLASEGQALLLAVAIASCDELRTILSSFSVEGTRKRCCDLGWFVPWLKECKTQELCLPMPK